MSTIAIESVSDPVGRRVFGVLRRAAEQCKTSVADWSFERAGMNSLPDDCGHVFVWEGVNPYRDEATTFFRTEDHHDRNLWHVGPSLTNGDGFQVDAEGTGAFSSWYASVSLPHQTGRPLFPSGGPLLILTQSDDSRGMRFESPWFSSTEDFIRFVMDNTSFQSVDVVWSEGIHNAARVRRFLDACGGVQVLDSPRPGLKPAAVVTVNHPSATSFINKHVPTMVFGVAPYRHESAVWCMDDNARVFQHEDDRTRRALKTPLLVESQRLLIRTLVGHEWDERNAAAKLKSLLAA